MKMLVNTWLLSCWIFAAGAMAQGIEAYQLDAGDVISIHVYGEDDLSMEVMITNSGKVDYPYLGTIEVAGITTERLKQRIEEGLRGDYLIQPKVAVNVVSYRQIFVNGEVGSPGGYPYQPGLTIDKAIALAGGFTQRAAKSSISLTTKGKVLNKVALSHAIAPGDIIVVKASFF
ncbi:polysaccharide biosynthesis/export family protein [Aliagarivorans marinus]|uniref:polysaccharide biosynthesis/export family protein n=1 Tax=Aliagarivorans marinus TaxID=561965 RepID=UPI000408116F|nr:polysaccharide biosynthesis/export family protein [Aliagarivorans marinus]